MFKFFLAIIVLCFINQVNAQNIEKEHSIISFLNKNDHHIYKDSGYIIATFDTDSVIKEVEFLNKYNKFYSNKYLDTMYVVLFTWKGKLYSGDSYKTIKFGAK